MNSLIFEQIDFEETKSLPKFNDETIHQTKEWLNFVAETQQAKPVWAVLKDGEKVVGKFTGMVVKKYGARILGSPFPGWTTSYMGFNLIDTIPRVEILSALEKFAFNKLNCVHLEIMDRHLTTADLDKCNYQYRVFKGMEVDLSKDEQDVYIAMKSSSCRYSIRKAEKAGVVLEIATDLSFADDYYAQLIDVFTKQKLVPTYTIERVKSLIKHLLPTGNLLLVRAKDSEGNCLATGIFPAFNDTMFFWGGASWRKYQKLCPNEALQWFAIKYWKAKGITKYDMGGGGEYKRKYGGHDIAVPWGRKSKYAFFEPMRNFGKNLFAAKQKMKGLIKP